MQVIVSSRQGTLRLAMVGNVDDAAPAIIEAALSVARADRMHLLVDAREAQPAASPILDAVRRMVRGAADRGASWIS